MIIKILITFILNSDAFNALDLSSWIHPATANIPPPNASEQLVYTFNHSRMIFHSFLSTQARPHGKIKSWLRQFPCSFAFWCEGSGVYVFLYISQAGQIEINVTEAIGSPSYDITWKIYMRGRGGKVK